AVAIVGLSVFSSEILAAWKTPGNAERALSSGDILEELLSFAAPAETVARFEAAKQEDEESMTEVSNDPLLAENWKFTQNPTANAYLLVGYLSSQAGLLKDFASFVK